MQDYMSRLPHLCLLEIFRNLKRYLISDAHKMVYFRIDLFRIMKANKKLLSAINDPSFEKIGIKLASIIIP